MIDFQRLDFARKKEYDRLLQNCGERGCEYSFANLYMWGRQDAAILGDDLLIFSQFNRQSIYPFPLIRSDAKTVLDAIIADAHSRKIRCRLTSLTPGDCELLEQLYPGRFRFYPDRDGYDYIYNIDDLAHLKGRKFQKKRNHLNRFRENHPDCRAVPLNRELLPLARQVVEQWQSGDGCSDPESENYLECRALNRAFRHFEELELEGMVLLEGETPIAMTMGSRLSGDTFDVHFEKALDVDGAYAAINWEFSNYLQGKYPELRYLNREDDLGLPGLRKAKLSYCPDHFIEKSWARFVEDDDED